MLSLELALGHAEAGEIRALSCAVADFAEGRRCRSGAPRRDKLRSRVGETRENRDAGRAHPEGSISGTLGEQSDHNGRRCRSRRTRRLSSVELLKRYTTLGWQPTGQTSNVNGHAIMAHLTGAPAPSRHHSLPTALYTVANRSLCWSSSGRQFGRPASPPVTPGRGTRRELCRDPVSGCARNGRATRRVDWLTTCRAKSERSEQGRRLRRLDPRQDRHPDRMRARSWTDLHQHVFDAADGKVRYGLMLRDDGTDG